ncbi:MAG: M20/M25/M40 family metallo-hydrolase [Chloroflexi bacterium]|nr:M20/M25/M40 family metallo-hydrolase [Chloroflexota bacterium]
MAYPYLTQELENLGYTSGIFLTDHQYSPYKMAGVCGMNQNLVAGNGHDFFPVYKGMPAPDAKAIWMNKVVTIPGHGPNANELVLITAHMDSISPQYSTNAPGAEDNASGVAALMEAARLFRFYKFDRTIKIIFFTGEEQGLYGSKAYVASHPSEMPNIVGVVNLDMFGYDADNDRCFELHVGTLSASRRVGTCFTDVIDNYDLNLTYDYLTNTATSASDHSSFWRINVGAIEVLENSFYNPGYGCQGILDDNPYYHTINDKVAYMNLPVTHAIAMGGIGTAASLASPMGKCFTEDLKVTAVSSGIAVNLSWTHLNDADVYNVYRSSASDGEYTRIAQVPESSYQDTDVEAGQTYHYKVQAAETDFVCFSPLSESASATVGEEPVLFSIYIPMIIAGD